MRTASADDRAGHPGEGQRPGDAYRSWRDAVPVGDRAQRAGQGQVGRQGRPGEVRVAGPPVARFQARRPRRGERAGEQALGHRAVDDRPGFVLARPQQDVGGGVAVDQVERRLDRVHGAGLLGLL
jgi:hypothetical protein